MLNLKQMLGKAFKVYPDGTVVDKKSKKYVGYLLEEKVDLIITHSYNGIFIDQIVRHNIKIPAMMQVFTPPKRNIIIERWKNRKNKIYPVQLYEARSELEELEFIILRDFYVNHLKVKSISSKLGYSKNYIYKLKSRGEKKIKLWRTTHQLTSEQQRKKERSSSEF